MGGCASKSSTAVSKTARLDEPMIDAAPASASANTGGRPSRQLQTTSSSNYEPSSSATTTRETKTAGRSRPPRSSGGRDRARNDTVDFQEFKDKEKNVVETMLESNKGLRMAEINFNDLKLQKIIGAGAFGEVIKGTYCGTPVVVKRMLRNKINEDNLRMFGDEIQLMMNLRHPNIVQVRKGRRASWLSGCGGGRVLIGAISCL